MNLTDFISIITGFGTLGSAIGTFVTVREMKLQRSINQKPDLIFGQNLYIVVRKKEDGWSNFTNLNNKENGNYYLNLDLANAGNGVAKDIKIHYCLPYYELNQLFAKSSKISDFLIFKNSNGGVETKWKTDGLIQPLTYEREDIEVKIPFIKVSDGYEMVGIRFSKIYLRMISLLLFCNIPYKKGFIHLSLPETKIFVQYCDHGHIPYEKWFRLNANIEHFSGQEAKIIIRIDELQ